MKNLLARPTIPPALFSHITKHSPTPRVAAAVAAVYWVFIYIARWVCSMHDYISIAGGERGESVRSSEKRNNWCCKSLWQTRPENINAREIRDKVNCSVAPASAQASQQQHKKPPKTEGKEKRERGEKCFVCWRGERRTKKKDFEGIISVIACWEEATKRLAGRVGVGGFMY